MVEGGDTLVWPLPFHAVVGVGTLEPHLQGLVTRVLVVVGDLACTVGMVWVRKSGVYIRY